MSKYNVGIFKNKDDIEFIFTNDDIINITGMIGSGKTTLAKRVIDKKNYKLLSLDWMFGFSISNRPEEIENLLKEMEKLYPEMKDQKIFKKTKENKIVEPNYYKYTDIIYKYLLQNIEQPVLIEGRHIYKYMNYKSLKGKLIIKRTSLFNSYRRALNRDVKNMIKRYKKKEVPKGAVLRRLSDRIVLPIKDYLKINKFIIELVNEGKVKYIKGNNS